MFRNAEYVLALKDLLNLRGKGSLDDYKAAFEKLDSDGSGYIETSEIQALFDDVYGEKAPSFETEAFLEFFDQNKDGKISWEEFEQGLGVAVATQMDNQDKESSPAFRLGDGMDDEEDDDDEYDDDESIDIDANVVGKFERKRFSRERKIYNRGHTAALPFYRQMTHCVSKYCKTTNCNEKAPSRLN